MYDTVAFSVARLTSALRTPAGRRSAFSTRLTQLAQVMPMIGSVSCAVTTPYPAPSTAATMSPVETSPGSNVTVAFSVARFTAALSTPWTLPMAFSVRTTQLAQVMPVMGNSMVVSRSLILLRWSVRSGRRSALPRLVFPRSNDGTPRGMRRPPLLPGAGGGRTGAAGRPEARPPAAPV